MRRREKSSFAVDELEKGVELLAYFLDDPKDKKEAIDLLELVTDRPELQREILEEAQRRRVPEVSPSASEREVEGASCLRCGREISTGYFVDTSGGEVGPFGSTCIRRVEEG